MPKYRYRIELNENYIPPIYIVKRQEINTGWLSKHVDWVWFYKFWQYCITVDSLEKARNYVDKMMHPAKIIPSKILETFEPEE